MLHSFTLPMNDVLTRYIKIINSGKMKFVIPFMLCIRFCWYDFARNETSLTHFTLFDSCLFETNHVLTCTNLWARFAVQCSVFTKQLIKINSIYDFVATLTAISNIRKVYHLNKSVYPSNSQSSQSISLL